MAEELDASRDLWPRMQVPVKRASLAGVLLSG